MFLPAPVVCAESINLHNCSELLQEKLNVIVADILVTTKGYYPVLLELQMEKYTLLKFEKDTPVYGSMNQISQLPKEQIEVN